MAETRITVEGTPYVLPALDTFDIDDAIILYDYSGLTFDAVWELEGLHPGVVKTLLHIAIARSDPSLRKREIEEMVGRVNMMDVMSQLADIAETMPDPTQAEALLPSADSKRSSDEPTASSGNAGSDSSELLPGELEPRLYWSPWLGFNCNLRPGDIGSLTPDQLIDAYDFRSQRLN